MQTRAESDATLIVWGVLACIVFPPLALVLLAWGALRLLARGFTAAMDYLAALVLRTNR